MPLHASWSGHLKLSLVSVPVSAFAAAESDDGEIHFHQLHQECHSRIRYQKTCPIHGEVANDEIVSGYEYAKDHYLVFSKDELNKLRNPPDKSVEIDAIIAAGSLDPLYFSGRSSYLIPDGSVGTKAYSLIHQSLAEENWWGVAIAKVTAREQIVLVRPFDHFLVLTGLDYASQVREPREFAGRISDSTAPASELKLTKTLLRSFEQKKFDIHRYKDEYTERVQKMIDAKREGAEIVEPPHAEGPREVINLMDALKKSLSKKPASSAETIRKLGQKAKAKPSSRHRKSG